MLSSSIEDTPWSERDALRFKIPQTVPEATLRPLVAVSAQLSEDQYRVLSVSLWNEHLVDPSPSVAAPV